MLELLFSLVSSTSLIIFAVTLLVVYVIKSWLNHPSDLPPMPCLPVPIFGHILYFKPSMRDALMKWKKQVGDIFSIYIGSTMIIVISNHHLLNESFVKHGDWFSDRPPSLTTKIWKEGLFGIGNNSGPSWKEQRTVSMSILREFGMGKNWLAEKISQEVEEYVRVLEHMQGKAENLQILTNTAVSNIICAILVGKRFEYGDPFLTGFVKQNIELLKLAGKTSTANAFPWLRFLPGDKFHVKQMLKNTLTLNEIFSTKFISQSKDDVDDTSTDNFIKRYLREMYKRKNSDLNDNISAYVGEINYEKTHLRRIIDILFVAGTDTTSTTLIWAFGFSIHYPECQKKIYDEILEVVGTERIPNMQDKSKLKYLNAFTLETQRIGSVVPIGVAHKCSKTTHIGGYRIPEGATILPYLDAVLKDERVWKDPYTFRPERFLDKKGNVFIPDEFIPFSLGRRVCMGEALAKMELFLFLSMIFQRFEVLPEDPNNLPPLVSAIGFTSSLIPFKVRMKSRPRL